MGTHFIEHVPILLHSSLGLALQDYHHQEDINVFVFVANVNWIQNLYQCLK